MPEITNCPKCDKKLRLPDNLFGKNVRCPGCATLFVAQPDPAFSQSPAAPARSPAVHDHLTSVPASRYPDRDDRYPEDRSPRRDERYEDDRDRSRRRYDDDYDRDDYRSRWRREYEDDYDYDDRYQDDEPQLRGPALRWSWVHLGLTLVLIGVLALIAAMGLSMFGNLIDLISFGTRFGGFRGRAFWAMGDGVSGLSSLLSIIGLIGVLGWFLLTLVGMGFCLFVPVGKRSKTVRVLAIVAFACTIAVFTAVPVIALVLGMLYLPLLIVGYALTLVVGLTAFICWILFLNALAKRLSDPALGGEFIKFMVLALVAPFVAAGIMLAAGLIFPLGFLVFLGLVLQLAMLALDGWYALLLFQLRILVGDRVVQMQEILRRAEEMKS